MATQSEPVTQPQTGPEYTMGQAHAYTMGGFRYFHVGVETTYSPAGDELGGLMSRLQAAAALLFGAATAGNPVLGPIVLFVLPRDGPEAIHLLAGFPVAPGVEPVGGAQIAELPPFRCLSLLCTGAVQHGGEAMAALTQAAKDAGLKDTGEWREWYLYFEGDDSHNNVRMFQLGIQ